MAAVLRSTALFLHIGMDVGNLITSGSKKSLYCAPILFLVVMDGRMAADLKATWQPSPRESEEGKKNLSPPPRKRREKNCIPELFKWEKRSAAVLTAPFLIHQHFVSGQQHPLCPAGVF